MILLASDALAAIRRHAADTYPDECCGALIGRPGGGIVEAFALPNTTEEGPRRRFLVRPRDYLAAEARAVSQDGELRGFYHSHPDHPALPSQYDLDHAWPNFSYVIVSVRRGRPDEIRCWRLRPDRTGFEEERIETDPATAPVTSDG